MTSSTLDNTEVAERVARLRKFAETDPQAAQDAAWAWIQRLGDGLPGHAAELDLAQLFAAGIPADVDGQTEGIFVGWTTANPDLDRTGQILREACRAVTGLGVMPWLGKKFDQRAQRGTNSVNWLALPLTALLAPRYRFRKSGGHWEGFDMLNRVENSVVSPGTRVLVLDYESIGTNPWPINKIRDEAVQITPGIFLGVKLWHQTNGYMQLAYWAARSADSGSA
jgi:hypothetical protein